MPPESPPEPDPPLISDYLDNSGLEYWIASSSEEDLESSSSAATNASSSEEDESEAAEERLDILNAMKSPTEVRHNPPRHAQPSYFWGSSIEMDDKMKRKLRKKD
jgi:hypothetical protein